MAQAAAKSTDDDLRADYEKMREDMAALRKDLNALTSHMKDLADDASSSAKRKLANGAAKAQDSALDAAAAAKALGEQNVAAVEQKIQAHPLASIAIAFGVGLVASQFMRRDKS